MRLFIYIYLYLLIFVFGSVKNDYKLMCDLVWFFNFIFILVRGNVSLIVFLYIYISLLKDNFMEWDFIVINNMVKRLIWLFDVMFIIGLKCFIIYFKMKEGNFFNNIFIGERFVVWVEGEVINWIDGNILKREMRC